MCVTGLMSEFSYSSKEVATELDNIRVKLCPLIYKSIYFNPYYKIRKSIHTTIYIPRRLVIELCAKSSISSFNNVFKNTPPHHKTQGKTKRLTYIASIQTYVHSYAGQHLRPLL